MPKKPILPDNVRYVGELEPESPRKVPSAPFIAGPVGYGADPFSPFKARTFTEGIPKGVTSSAARLLRGILSSGELLEKTPSIIRGMTGGPTSYSESFIPEQPKSQDPLDKFKTFLKEVESQNQYASELYKGESLQSLFGKFTKTNTVEDLQRLTDYTANKVAEQIPVQLAIWGGAAVGVPPPLTLSLLGASAAGNKFEEDKELYPHLKPEDRLWRAYGSGALEAGTEGISYGLAKTALAGRSALEAIPGLKPVFAKALSQSGRGVFSSLAKTIGATPARRAVSNILFNMIGEGGEEVIAEAGDMWMDEHYKLREYELKDYLDRSIEAFGISVIASGFISTPFITISELQAKRQEARQTGNTEALPTPEELVTISHVIERYKTGLPGSQNPENQLHVVSGDVILLQELSDDMLQKGDWNDGEGKGTIEILGAQILKHLQENLLSEKGFLRIGNSDQYFDQAFKKSNFKPGEYVPKKEEVERIVSVSLKKGANQDFAQFVIGPTASGKTSIVKGISADTNLSIIDPDIYKEQFPGYTPETANQYHEASSVANRMAMDIVEKENIPFINVVTGRNTEKFKKILDDLNKRGRETSANFVYVNLDESLRRMALRRSTKKGINVPDEAVRANHEGSIRTLFEAFIPLARRVEILGNPFNASGSAKATPIASFKNGVLTELADEKEFSNLVQEWYTLVGRKIDDAETKEYIERIRKNRAASGQQTDLRESSLLYPHHESRQKNPRQKSSEVTPFLSQPESVKQSYNRNDITATIGEISREIRSAIEIEADALKDFGQNFKGGEVIRPDEMGPGYRTSLPNVIKHPKTGNKPVNDKQWRELAIYNLEHSRSTSGSHKEYFNLKQLKKFYIEKLVDIEMEAASVQIIERERANPKQLQEMSDEERAWFELSAKQLEVFDEVPPSDYQVTENYFGSIEPKDLKDISGIEMHAKDFYRNFEKVFGKHFPKIEKNLIKPLDESVNEYVEFQRQMTNELKSEFIDKLGIKKKSKLSSAVQEFGEGLITEQDLRSRFSDQDVERIKVAEKWFRSKYDELIKMVNKVRASIYPNNQEKLIPYRKNYFRHFHEMSELSGIKNLFDTPANIPSELAGTSQYTKPKSKFLAFALPRLGIMTDVDAIGGFLNYLPAAAQAIYVDPMIPKIRSLEKKLRVLTHDTKNANNFIEFLMMYANDLAGKTNIWDRAVQQVIGRKTIRGIDWITRRVKRNMILFNIASSISQLFNLPQAIGKTKLHFAVGTADYLKSIFTKTGPHTKSLFLNTRYASDIYDSFDTKIMNQPMKLAKWMLQILDEVATKMTWYSFYDMAVANKIEDPVRYADVNTRKMVAGRALHEVPLGQKSRVFQALQPFMIEVQNLWWVLGDMKREKDFVGLALFAVASWLMNSGAELIRGYRVSFDPINMLIDAFSGNKTIPQRVGRILGEISSNMPFGRQAQEIYLEYGWTTASGYKMPTRRQFFGEGDTTRFGSKILAFQVATEPQYFLFPPAGGGQAKKIISGAKALEQGYVKSGNKKIRFKQTPTTQVKALAFGKGSIPEVRQYYQKQNDKKAKTKVS